MIRHHRRMAVTLLLAMPSCSAPTEPHFPLGRYELVLANARALPSSFGATTDAGQLCADTILAGAIILLPDSSLDRPGYFVEEYEGRDLLYCSDGRVVDRRTTGQSTYLIYGDTVELRGFDTNTNSYFKVYARLRADSIVVGDSITGMKYLWGG